MNINNKLAFQLAEILAVSYINLVGKTSKIYEINKEYEQELLNKKANIIYTFWHNNLFFFTYYYRNSGIYVLTSQSRDAEIITKIMERQGIPAVRGSSTRGGKSALISLIKLLKQGKHIGITPDGPKGPKYEIKEGVLYLAKKTNSYILPLANYPKKRIVFNSWDNFILPLPFNQIVVIYGKPLTISSNDDIKEKKEELKRRLLNIVKEGEEFFKK